MTHNRALKNLKLIVFVWEENTDHCSSDNTKSLVGQCSFCNRKKPMIVGDNTIQAGGLADLFIKSR